MSTELDKQCSCCRKNKPLDEFHKARGRPLDRHYYCKQCIIDKRVMLSPEQKLKRREYINRRTAKVKKEVITYYGGKCACCGEAAFEYLAIDHIKGGGGQHIKKINTPLYEWLRRNGFPEGYRVLCFSCNMAAGLYGRCPHPNGVITPRKEKTNRIPAVITCFCSRCRQTRVDFSTNPKTNKPYALCDRCRAQNTPYIKELGRQRRKEAIKRYGGKCACCGETQPDFLAIDHIEGGGVVHRREIKAPFYNWLYNNNYPYGYRVLCHNCNCALAFSGFSPKNPSFR